MKKGLILFVVLFFIENVVSGFEMNYSFGGEHVDINDDLRTTDPRHEKITENAVYFLCKKTSKDFINDNLGDFIDVGSISDCEQLKSSETIYSLKRGVRYNDVPEVDGFTAMNKNYYDEYKGWMIAACAAFYSGLCVAVTTPTFDCPFESAIMFSMCPRLNGLTSISDEANLGNEDQYPIMHAQLNHHNFFNNPKVFNNVIRNYVKSYFYELVALSLTSVNSEPENMFVSYDDFLQHDSTDADDFIKDISYRKILMGELFHTIEDSFAHNIRYVDYIINDKNEEEPVMKTGVVLNMKSNIYEGFSHSSDFGPMEWNCVDVDDTVNWTSSDQALNVPLDFNNLDMRYFDNFAISGSNIFPFIKEEYASTMASHAVAEFLWRLGRAIKDPNNSAKTEDSINKYLDRWFTDGTAIFEPTERKTVPEEYESLVYSSDSAEIRWDNFYNVDLWEQSGIKDRTETGYKVSILPWIDSVDFGIVAKFNRRFVVKTFEDDINHPEYDNSITWYDDETKIMHLGRSSFYIFTSWSYRPYDTTNIHKVDMTVVSFFDGNGKVLEQLIETLPESTAAIFVPRGFKVCLFYDHDGVEDFNNNNAAKFFKMPTYRCFYGGENGRLVTSGKEDALKPGTKVMAMPVDGDGDGYFYLNDFDKNDNCPVDYNKEQWDQFRKTNPDCNTAPCDVTVCENPKNCDGIGDMCQDSDLDGVLDYLDKCQGGTDREDKNKNGIPDKCDPFSGDDTADADGDKVGEGSDNCPGLKNDLEPAPLNELVYANIRNTYDSDYRCPENQSCVTAGMLWNPVLNVGIYIAAWNTIIKDWQYHHLQTDLGSFIIHNVCETDEGCPDKIKFAIAEIRTQCQDFNSDSDRKNCAIEKFGKRIKNGTMAIMWQPDHDLDGSGDACDPDFLFSKITKADEVNVVTGYENADENGTFGRREFHNAGDAVLFNFETTGAKELSSLRKKVSVGNYYCAVATEAERKRWGEPGVCTTAVKDFNYVDGGENYRDYYNGWKPIYDFGYSHGSDPRAVNRSTNRQMWFPMSVAYSIKDADTQYSRAMAEKGSQVLRSVNPGELTTSNPFDAIVRIPNDFLTAQTYWAWRADYCRNQAIDGEECKYILERKDNAYAKKLYYALSSGIIYDKSLPYLASETVNGQIHKYLNPLYFYNKNIMARSDRFNSEYQTVSYRSYSNRFTLGTIIEYTVNKLYPPIVGEYIPEAGRDYDRYFIRDIGLKGSVIKVTDKSTEKNMITSATDGKYFYSLRKNPDAESGNKLSIWKGSRTGNSDWVEIFKTTGLPENYDKVTSIFFGNRIFFAFEESGGVIVYYNDLNSETPENFVEINGLELNGGVKFFTVNEKLYAIGNGRENVEIYKMDVDSQDFDMLELFSKPLKRSKYSIQTDENNLYLSGGITENGFESGEIYSINFSVETQKWNLMADMSGVSITGKPIIIDEGNMIFADISAISGEKMKVIEITMNDWDFYEYEITVEGLKPVFASNQCLSENNYEMYPGIISGGVCLPVMIGSEGTYDTGKTNYAVAGIDGVIYVAQGNGLEVFKAKTMTKTGSRSLYGPVKDLVVKGTKLFAAAGNGIDVFDISAKENPVLTKHIATYGDTTSFDIEGNDLYVGDGQGIKVFDTETLALKKQKNTSGDTEALEYFDGKVFVYEWSGFRIYDAATMNRLYSNGFYCNDPKLRSDEEAVYLACGTYIRKVEWNYSLTTVNGKKESFQRGHAFENILYLPNAKKITSSAIGIAPVPVCGNGIIETGEICDKNTVQCTTLSSDYISGTATCNSTCSGYNTGSCEEDDGW